MSRAFWKQLLTRSAFPAPKPYRRDSARPLHVTRLEERVVPTGDLSFTPASYYLWQPFGTLSGPTPAAPLSVALGYLNAHATDFGLKQADVQNPIVTNQYADSANGITHIYLQQKYNGLAVENARMAVHVAANGSVMSVTGGFISVPISSPREPVLTAVQAVMSAASQLGYQLQEAPIVTQPSTGPDLAAVVQAPGLSLDAIPVHLNYSAQPDGVHLSWSIVARTPDNQHWFDLTLDATTGELLLLYDWSDNLEAFKVLPLPIETPDDGAFGVRVAPFDPNSSPQGWHGTNTAPGPEFLVTRGNNVNAYEDSGNNNARAQPSGGAGLQFLFDADLTKAPNQYRPAVTTNLFYTNNMLHDIHYQYGFDEVSGNFQQTNFTGLGAGGDYVQAEAQDGSGTNNANFSTPPDGFRPRMQMFVWTSASPDRDSDLDNVVIIHEYGHGVSNRLTGGPANSNALNNQQSGGMGEGWSDWWGLMLTEKPGDSKATQTGLATYLINQPPTGLGIRDYRYTFNIGNQNLETFLNYGTGAGQSTAVHDAGTRWSSTLWDMNWLMTDLRGFDPDLTTGYQAGGGPGSDGNKVALREVMDALKLQPANPSFIAARDAILQADINLTSGAFQRAIWTAFARRGLGFGASTPSSNSSTLTTSFAMPAAASNPGIVAQSIAGRITTAPTSITFTFSEAMDVSSFNVATDVVSFLDPLGANLKPQITGFAWGAGDTQLTLNFSAALTTQGKYTLVLGPDIRDTTGNQMDQNLNGTAGQLSDQYTAYFRFDATTLQVTATTPADTASVTNPVTIDYTFSEAVNPSTVNVDNIKPTTGTVTGATVVNPNTVRYTITAAAIGQLFVDMKYGAVTDLFDFPVQFHQATFTVINGQPTGVTAGGPYAINEGQGVTLVATATDPENEPLTYSWDINGDTVFGDATGKNPTLTWAQLQALSIDDGLLAGTVFNVKVRVNDPTSPPVESAATTLTLNNVAPNGSLGTTPTTPAEGPTPIVVTANVSDPSAIDNAGLTFVWTVTKNAAPFLAFSGQGTASISFTDADAAQPSDAFAVSLVVSDDDGGVTTLNRAIAVLNIAPTAAFANNGPAAQDASVTFSFTGQTDPSVPDTTAGFRYSYDFNNNGNFTDAGDILNSASPTAAKLFASFGTFTIRGRIADDDGGFTDYTSTVTVNGRPTGVSAGTAKTINEGQGVTLLATGSDPENDPLTFSWDINNDNAFGDIIGKSPTLTWAQLQAFNIDDGLTGGTIFNLRVQVNDGINPVITSPATTLTLNNVAPNGSLAVVPAIPTEGPAAIVVNANVTDPSATDNAILTRVWAVTKNGSPFVGFTGQGTASISITDADAIQPSDSFNVSLTVSDDDGGTTVLNKPVAVANVAPTAVFNNSGPAIQYSTITFTFAGQFDPSVPDTNAGFLYSFDFNNNGSYTDAGDILNSVSPIAPSFYGTFGDFIVRGRIADDDGGFTEYTTPVHIDKLGNGGIIDANYFAIGAGAGGGPHVRVFNPNGTQRFGFFAYAINFAGGVRVATGDVNGDGTQDIITAPGAGGGPHVKVFDGKTGVMFREFMAFAPAFTGGVLVTSGDVNRDNFDDIIMATGAGVASEVKIISGRTGGVIDDFFPYGGFTGGANVGAGDVNYDGFSEVVTGAGAGGGPHVRVRDGQTGILSPGFFAFAPSFLGGVFVAAGDVTGDHRADLIVGSGADAATDGRIRVFDAVDLTMIRDYVTYAAFRGGVRVATIDLNADGVSDIITSAGPGTSATGTATPPVLGLDGRNLGQIHHFNAYDPTFLGGVYVG